MDRNIPLYERLASRIVEDIEGGVYTHGDKIPSIRRQSRIRNMSINTVKEAYRLLERKGYVEAVPQSGYYIRRRRPEFLKKPEVPTFELHSSTASTSELWRQVHRDADDPELNQLGILKLDVGSLPIKKLNRALSSSSRMFPGRCITDDSFKGEARLRRQIALRYSEIDCFLRPEDIYITSGCTSAVFLALIALTRPGDHILVEQPFFTSALQLWGSLGLRIIEIPADPVTGIIVESFERAVRVGNAKACVLVPNFNNPLGSLLPDDAKKEIARLCEQYDLPLIEDDVFGDLADTPHRPRTIKGFDLSGNVILASSFSKSLAPGYRIGWIAPGKYTRQIESLMMAVGSGGCRAAQLALSSFLMEGDYDRHIRAVRSVYRSRRDAMAETVDTCFPVGTCFVSPKGGLVMWVELPEGHDTKRLYFAAHRQGIAIMPGCLFTLRDLFHRNLRLNFARWDKRTNDSLRLLGRILKTGDL